MPELEEGHRLGRYRIEAFLAEGGMGRVYRAFDTMLGRRVALKVLTGDAAPGSAEIARLVRGARAAAAFSHPNVCSVFDAGEVDGQPFIAMELVEGASLRRLIADPEIELAERLRWVVDLARALAAAHRARVVHRDIKPDNVMIDADGRVRLLDFGVAKWEDSEPEPPATELVATASFRTQAGRVVGTRGYMAPEQLDGGPVDARTDQFAWGVLAYEAIAREHPFGDDAGDAGDGGDGGANAYRVPPLLSARVPALPFGVAAVVAKAMSIDPAQRFADMAELVAQLAPLVQTRPPVARRRRVLVGAVAVAAVGGAAAAVAVAARSRAPAPGAMLAVSHLRRLTFGEGCEEYPSFTPDGRSVVFSARDATGNVRIQRLELDGSAAPRTIVTHDHDGWDIAPAVSPDGARVAFLHMGRDRASAMIAPLDGSAPPRAIGPATMFPRWSADGRALWAGKARAIALYDATTGGVLRTVALPTGLRATWMYERRDGTIVAHVNQGGPTNPTGLVVLGADGAVRWQVHEQLEPALAPSPDGAHVIASRQTFAGEAELVAIPLDGAPTISLSATGIVARDGLAISADGTRLAWSTCHPSPHVAAVAADGAFAIAIGEQEDPIALAAIRGGDLAVVSARTGRPELWVMDPRGARAPRQIALGGRFVRDVAVSLDGARFAVVVEGAGIAVGAFGGDALRMVTSNGADASPGFRRDGEVVFTHRFSDGSPQVMLVPASGGIAVPILEPGSHNAAASPVDDRIAYILREPGVSMVFDPATRAARPLSPALGSGRYRQLRFSPDGKRVVMVRGDRELVEVDAATGALVRTATTSSGDMLHAPAYAADGLLVVRVRWQGNLYVADAAFGAAVHESAAARR